MIESVRGGIAARALLSVLVGLLALALFAPVGEAKRVRVFAVGPKLDLAGWLDTREHFHDKLFALFDASRRDRPGTPLIQGGADDVASHLLGPANASRPSRSARDLVTLPEDAGLWSMLVGPRGEVARAQGSSVAGVASLGAAYAPQLAYYEAQFPSLAARGVPSRALMLALTDTFGRVAVETFAELADRYDVWLVAGVNMARDWRVVCMDREAFNSAEPPHLVGGVRCFEQSPEKVLALRDPTEPDRDYAYEATTPEPVNMALVFDPQGRLASKQVKAYLTPLELPGVGLDLKPGGVSGLEAVSSPVGTLGIVTSKDAWMPDVQAKLDQRRVDVLIQPEYFTGDTAATSGPWAADTLRASGYNAVLAQPGFEAMVMPQLTGNAFDIPSDQQSQIVRRIRSKRAPRRPALIGQAPARGFRAVAPWVVPDPLGALEPFAERRRRLGEAGEAMLPGSGVSCPDPAVPGPCENGQVERVLFADVQVKRQPRRRPYRGPRVEVPFSRNRPVAPSRRAQRNVDLAVSGRTVVVAFEEVRRGRSVVLVARSPNGGRTFARQPVRPVGQGRREQWNPAVAAPGRRVYVAWTEVRPHGQRIQLALSKDGGRSFGRPVTVPPASGAPRPHTQWLPELAAGTGGAVHLVYLEESEPSEDDSLPQTHVHHRRVHPDLSLDPALRLDGGEPVELAAKLDHSWAPDVAARGERVAVAWVDFRTYDWRPYARLSASGGESFGPELEVSRSLTSSGEPALEQLANSPSVALYGRRAYVAWTDWRKDPQTAQRPSSDHDTWLAATRGGAFGRAPRLGGAFRPEARADDLGDRQASTFWPAVAARRGDALVAWQDSRSATGDIRIARLIGGSDRRRSVRVDDTGRAGANQYRPAIARSGRRVIVAWEDERNGPLQIYFAGAPWSRLAP